MSLHRKRTAIFISGGGSNMVALVQAARATDFPAEIVLVLSNRPESAGLERAKALGIPVAAVDHRIYAGRADFEASIQRLLEIHRIELICLAGFMRILTPGFVTAWTGRMINIHPSLLPAYTGLHTHARVLTDGGSEHGCTVHYVTPGLDEGPAIAHAIVPVLEGDTPETLAARVLVQEHRIYPLALEIVARAGPAGNARSVLDPRLHN